MNKKKAAIIGIVFLFLFSLFLYMFEDKLLYMLHGVERGGEIFWKNMELKVPEDVKYIKDDDGIIFYSDKKEGSLYLQRFYVTGEVEKEIDNYFVSINIKISEITKKRYNDKENYQIKFDRTSSKFTFGYYYPSFKKIFLFSGNEEDIDKLLPIIKSAKLSSKM